ncbi:MAG TPA: HlyD family efflux transporter periplasmic adaptor subunit [Bryobacteraceae bacterium]|nr:HlyD family efflux transporter periplasmic adaptor subunit [Bryobacteraceae bacterium]
MQSEPAPVAPAVGGSAPTSPAARVIKVTSGPLERTLRLAGQTGATDYANIVAPLLRGEGGREMILIDVAPAGSWVKKGAKIAQIDAQSLIDRLDDMDDSIEAARSEIDKRKAQQAVDWENLQQSIRVAAANLDKARLDLRASEVKTDLEKQILRLNLEEAEASHKQLQSDLAQKKIGFGADLKILEMNLNRTVLRRERLAKDMQRYTVIAPMEGLVVMSSIVRNSEVSQVQQGDRLFPGQPFMKIVNTRKMQVEASVNQAQSGDVRVGQDVRIGLDAFKDLRFPGKVVSMGALAAGSMRGGNYIRNIPVRITIIGSDPRLIPDLSASADVILSSEANATLVPLSAVHEEDGKAFAYVKTGETFVARDLALGLRNDTHAVVRSGLQPGEEVRVN